MTLSGKTAIVTGAGSGFGAGIAAAFVRAGAKVLVADIDADKASAVAAEFGADYAQVDVSQNGSVAHLCYTTSDVLGEVDIIVNNAGITHLPQPMESVTGDEFDRVLAVNAKSVYLMARHFVPAMKDRKSGVILNVASTAGVSPRPNLNWYNACKGWMITATKAMAVELAPYNIRVNALNPVAGETPLLSSFLGGDTPELRAKFLPTVPMARFSTPQDMGDAAVFLRSDTAGMITGTALAIDGGRCI